MTDSTVNEHLVEQLRKESLCFEHSHEEAFKDTRLYKRFRKRINFLLRVRNRYGRDFALSWDEMDKGIIYPWRLS